MKFSTIAATSVFFIAAFLVISSCNRKEDTIAKVYIFDKNDNPVSSAEVIVYAEPSENSIDKDTIPASTAITNATGEAIFNFNELYQLGQSGVAVLNIIATKDTLEGAGVIQVIEEQTSEAKVRIQ
ncbi:MAG: hypothetical protein K0R65_476 [Crocinitomicaceae bacterium]|jgi:Tol biopolymer transport system component|nr:hypothetical protein [Crocinitomicaceae bacterium]